MGNKYMKYSIKEQLQLNKVKANGLFLMDMDGTVYNDTVLFEGVKEFLSLIKTNGGRYVFVTNNSSKSVEDYISKLSAMGIASCATDFFTSTQATVFYLEEHFKNKKVFCVGTRSFVAQLSAGGIRITQEYEQDADIVLVAFDTELTYQKLYDASRLLYEGKVFLATNCDRGCPVGFGLIPDCGAICEALYFATWRRPKYIGKPEPDMIRYAMQMTGYTEENTLLVGDRLYTDIASGINAGVKTLLVFSGETTPEMLSAADIKPDMTCKDIKELYEALIV